jgi:hypothetical protein
MMCSAEWLRPDARRTATGLDLDEDALRWGAAHNFGALPDEGCGRICLLLGNVLQPIESAQDISRGREQGDGLAVSNVEIGPGTAEQRNGLKAGSLERTEYERGTDGCAQTAEGGDLNFTPTRSESEGEPPNAGEDNAEASGTGQGLKGLDLNGNSGSKNRGPKLSKLHRLGADIICAFNYSTCCLHSRQQLLRYFQYARKGLSDRGGVFAMDLYGGTSSECALRMKRRFGDFTVSELHLISLIDLEVVSWIQI